MKSKKVAGFTLVPEEEPLIYNAVDAPGHFRGPMGKGKQNVARIYSIFRIEDGYACCRAYDGWGDLHYERLPVSTLLPWSRTSITSKDALSRLSSASDKTLPRSKSLTQIQLETLRCFTRMPASDLRHLAIEVGLDLTHYRTHRRLACGMTVYLYRDAGLSSEVKAELDRRFIAEAGKRT